MSDFDRELLERHADGELTAEEQSRVAALVSERAELADEIEQVRLLRGTLCESLKREGVPDRLNGCICSAIRNGTAGRSVMSIGASRWRIAAMVALSAAAVWLVASNLGLLDGFRGAPGESAAVAAVQVAADEFAGIYTRCACGGGHDQLALAPDGPTRAAARIIDIAKLRAAVPDLSSEGYTLSGVCLCFPSRDVKVVHAHYRSNRSDDDAVSVFTTDRPVRLKSCGGRRCDRSKRQYQESTVEGVNIVKWDEASGSVAVCGRRSPQELETLAEAVRIALRRDAAPSVARR